MEHVGRFRSHHRRTRQEERAARHNHRHHPPPRSRIEKHHRHHHRDLYTEKDYYGYRCHYRDCHRDLYTEKRHHHRHQRPREEENEYYQRRRRRHGEKHKQKNLVQVVVDLPWDIICNILSRLPITSLCRFRTVSKTWNDLMRDPYFINLHLNHALPKPPTFIVTKGNEAYMVPFTNRERCLTYINVMMERKNRWVARKTPIEHSLYGARVEVCSTCNGLVCLTDLPNILFFETYVSPKIIIYNPVTRESISLPILVIDMEYVHGSIYVGFDSKKNNYKVIIRWRRYVAEKGVGELYCYIHTLGESCWRNLEFPEYEDVTWEYNEEFVSESVAIDGELYWIINRKKEDSDLVVRVLAMDICNEDFRVIEFVVTAIEFVGTQYELFMSGKRLALCGIYHLREDQSRVFQIWHLVDNKKGIWIHQTTHTVSIPYAISARIRIVGAVGDDSLLLKLFGDFHSSRLFLFNMRTNKLHYDFISGDLPENWIVHSYMPTLVNPKI